MGISNPFAAKKPKIDTAGITDTVNQSANQQKGVITQALGGLSNINTNFGTGSAALGASYQTDANKIGANYQAGLAGLADTDKAAMDRAIEAKTKQNFQNVPMQQQAVREALASTGGLRTGHAGIALAQPVMQAAQDTSNFSDQLAVNNLHAQSARAEKGIDALYSTEAGSALQKFGLDRDTMSALMQAGRTDIINNATQMLGIDQQQVANLLGIEQLKANMATANAASSNALKGAILQGIGTIGGAVVGGPAGAAIGNRVAAGLTQAKS